jgi:hypothetical protein
MLAGDPFERRKGKERGREREREPAQGRPKGRKQRLHAKASGSLGDDGLCVERVSFLIDLEGSTDDSRMGRDREGEIELAAMSSNAKWDQQSALEYANG